MDDDAEQCSQHAQSGKGKRRSGRYIYIVSNGESVLIMKGDPEEMSAEGKDPALAAARLRLQEAFEKKLHVCFCLKAMSLRDLSLPEDLGRAELVASSAFRMAELQEQGYAYIKS